MFFVTDLLDAGVSPAQMRDARRDSVRVSRGAYVPKALDAWERYTAQCRAVLRRLRPGAYLTGPSAAIAWGLPLVGKPPKAVTVGGVARGRYARDVLVVPGKAETRVLGDLLVASPQWTVADCARLLDLRGAAVVADAALHARLCSVEDLCEVLASLGRSHGVARVRWIVDATDGASESPGETWTRMRIRELGYDATSQVVVRDGDFVARVDLLLSDGRTVLEFDGDLKYRGPEHGVAETLKDEKRRQARLEALGYVVLRILWEQLRDLDAVERRLLRAGARPRRPRTTVPAMVVPPVRSARRLLSD